ncbi:MAG TPA: UDP-N-acetylmuramate--L-alanine ligase [Pirellulales bacterium]|nr:UDP-N-acetylmuramate--L-alanine ligase [Pirellulales bacterium]
MNIALHATRMGFPRLAEDTIQRAHLIGIAGCGMRALAELLLTRGWRLTGSDLDPSGAAWLAEAGVRLDAGHAAEHVPPDADLVIYSDAVPEDNCERRRATELGLSQRSYPSMLGDLMERGFGLAVAGTHGKSTTTAMAAEILDVAGFSPSVVAGGTPLGRNSGGRRGRGQFVLVEACEYRSNFLRLTPRTAVILGIEPDHFDCFPSRGSLEAAFAAFVRRVPADGLLLAQASCAATRRVLAGATCRIATFGLETDADWRAKILRGVRGRYDFKITRRGRSLGEVALAVAGRHQVVNALAAAALAGESGASGRDIVRGLSQFAGLRRRFERVGIEAVGIEADIVLLDDYAHHPSEIAATLATVREAYPGRRVWCVFQPHQASRTRFLLEELAASLRDADRVAVTEVFPAREAASESDLRLAAELASRVRARGGMVLTAHDTNGILEHVSAALNPGDLLITLGAGDIRKVCDAFARRLRTYRAAI